jgi:hypothetical protein
VANGSGPEVWRCWGCGVGADAYGDVVSVGCVSVVCGGLVRVPVAGLVAELAVGGDRGREPVGVGVRSVWVVGAARTPVGGGDLGGAGVAPHAEHRVGVGLVDAHGDRRGGSGERVGPRWLIAV